MLYIHRWFLASILLMALSVQAQTTDFSKIVTHPHMRRSSQVQAEAGSGPPYETPASLACVYQLVSNPIPGCPVLTTTALPSGGSGTIAIVNAFDDPKAANDLNIFSSRFGLPQCNQQNPCFKKVYVTGTRPPTDPLWAENGAAGVEYSHAFAPQAQIVLIEAASPSVADLMLGVELANQIITTSPGGKGEVLLPFGIPEFADETAMDSLFTTPGVIYISGNEGAPGFLEYPATSPNVIAIGGSVIQRDSTGNFFGELATLAWAGDTSMFEARPSYQDAIQSIVGTQRGVPDLAFGVDPFFSPERYYVSVPDDGFEGWQFTGHVGFAEAALAGIINIASGGAGSSFDELTRLYSGLGNPAVFRDIEFGSALGVRAMPGWDFVTGLGSPIGFVGK